MSSKVTCSCGWSWDKKDSSKKDMYVCHECGKDNTMKNGGWLDKFQNGGEKLTTQPLPFNTITALKKDVEKFRARDVTKQDRINAIRENNANWNINDYKQFGLKEPGIESPAVDPIDLIGGAIAGKTLMGAIGAFNLAKKPIIMSGFNLGTHPKTLKRATNALAKITGSLSGSALEVAGGTENDYNLNTKFNDGGPIQPNYNDADAFYSEDYVGAGYDIVGRNYSPAWGGQFEHGGTVPGSVGFTYARTKGIPSNGPYAKKTKASAQDGKEISYDQWKKQYKLKETPDYNLKRAWELGYTPDKTGHLPTVDNQTGQFLKSKGHPTLKLELDWYNSPEGAEFKSKNTLDSTGKFFKYIPKLQNGKEMQFYQNGLDWKPKSISRDGSVIEDDRGQWDHPGEITKINSNEITMQGVDYPVLGVSDTGDTQMMQPGEDYTYDGNSVTEYPMMKDGGKSKPKLKPIYVTDKNDPRYIAYKDSSLLNTRGEEWFDNDMRRRVMKDNPYVKGKDITLSQERIDNALKNKPTGKRLVTLDGGPGNDVYKHTYNNGKLVSKTFVRHEKAKPIQHYKNTYDAPNQEVIYQDPNKAKKPSTNTLIVNDKNDPRLKSYSDSSKLYNMSKDTFDPKHYNAADKSWYTYKGVRDNSFEKNHNIDYNFEYYRTGKFPGKIQPVGTKDWGEGMTAPIYGKPKRQVIYEAPYNRESLQPIETSFRGTSNIDSQYTPLTIPLPPEEKAQIAGYDSGAHSGWKNFYPNEVREFIKTNPEWASKLDTSSDKSIYESIQNLNESFIPDPSSKKRKPKEVWDKYSKDALQAGMRTGNRKMEDGGWLSKYDAPKAQTGLDFKALMNPGIKQDATKVVRQEMMSEAEAKKFKARKDAEELARRKQAISTSAAAKKKSFSAKQLAEETGAIGDKFRMFPNDPDSFIDEYINPGVMVGNMASGLGRVPLNIQEGNYGEAAMAVGTPLAMGALGGLQTQNTGQFANNLFNPLAGISSIDSRALSRIKPTSQVQKFSNYDEIPFDINNLSQKDKSLIDLYSTESEPFHTDLEKIKQLDELINKTKGGEFPLIRHFSDNPTFKTGLREKDLLESSGELLSPRPLSFSAFEGLDDFGKNRMLLTKPENQSYLKIGNDFMEENEIVLPSNLKYKVNKKEPNKLGGIDYHVNFKQGGWLNKYN